MTTTADRTEVVAFLALLLIPCGAAAAFAMRDTSAPPVTVSVNRPALVFSSYLYSTGSEPLDDQPLITEEFPFLNKSDREVRITGLEASCGCLAPQVSSKTIAPGATGRVSLPIRTANEAAGPHEYLVVVKYEDPEPRQVTLTWQLVLPEKQVLIEPKVLMVMGSVSADQSYDIVISDHRPQKKASPITIESIATSSPLISASHAGQNLTGEVPTSRIAVRFQPPIPAGRHRGLLLMKTDDDAFPYLHVPVIVGGSNRPPDEPASASPENAVVIINTNDVAVAEPTLVTFDIPAKWTVTHCDVFPSQLSATMASPVTGTTGQQTIAVTLAVSSLPDYGIERGVLTLNATDGDQAEMVTVPLSLVVKRAAP